MLKKDYAKQDCALAAVLEVLGERWTLLIVRDAFLGVRRFSDFVTQLGIPRAVLAERLSSLVAHGVLEKRSDPARPGRFLYELSAAGQELWPVLHGLISWSARHVKAATNRYIHAECGTELSAGAVCPACHLVPAPADVLVIPRTTSNRAEMDPISAAIRQPRRLLQPIELPTQGATGDSRTASRIGA